MKATTLYRCSNCGYESAKWMGYCSSCSSWNTFEEKEIEGKKKSAVGIGNRSHKASKPLLRLSEVVSGNSDRIITGIHEFNRVFGGGIVKDSVTIITARPGAGKSTLLLQVADDVAAMGYKVVYASGEESESQIKNRADRILQSINPNIWVISDTSMDHVLSSVVDINPDLVIIDSIQSFTLNAFQGSRAGSPTQTMECANELVQIAKGSDQPRAVILIGQMTKNDEIAGLRALEHLVDAVFYIEGEDEEELRGFLATKNRFGSTGEMGFFSMTEQGMISIDNPSKFFMTKRENGEIVSGSALTVIREGSRPIIVEIESLVSNSFTPFPSRIGECLRREQLHTLISVLEQRGSIPLFNKNVVIKTTGGIKLKEQAVNLSVIMSIVSSVYNQGIPNDTVFIADVGLTGELKKVPSLEGRIRELDRMGFQKVYVAKNSLVHDLKLSNVEVIECKNLYEVILRVFGKPPS